MCSSPDSSAGNCSESQPITIRACQAPPCSGDQRNSIIQWLSRSGPEFPAAKISSRQRCRGDRSVFCRMEALSRYCSIAGYRQMCCKSCSEGNSSSIANITSTSPPAASNDSFWRSTTEVVASVSWLHNVSINSTTAASVTATRPPTSRGSTTDFVYVEYDDYEDYSSYEETLVSIETPAPSASTTSPPYLFKKRVSTPTVTQIPTQLTTVATLWAHSDDIIREGLTVPPELKTNRTKGEQSHKAKTTPTNSSSSSSSSLPHGRLKEKKENNSVDEVSYRIVGLDPEISRGQQNYFVPRMPPLRERTQNKRIQELLNEKRQKDLQQRPRKTKDPLLVLRTDQRHADVSRPHT